MTFDQLRIEIRVLLWEYRIKILIGAVALLAVVFGIAKMLQIEAARVAAFTPEYKASISEGEQILDSAKRGDFIVTRGGILLRVEEAGRNDPALENIMIKVFPRLVHCATGRHGPMVRDDTTLSRVIGRIPAVSGKPDAEAQAKCKDQGSIGLYQHGS